MDQLHSNMFIMVFYVIAGPPSSFLSFIARFWHSLTARCWTWKRLLVGANRFYLAQNLEGTVADGLKWSYK